MTRKSEAQTTAQQGAGQAGQGPQPASAPLRVAAYVRFSSRNQRDGYSIAAQQAEIEREGAAWTARTGQAWNISWHIEPERSAREEKISKRVVFRDLLAAAAQGEHDLVVVHKLDRFARSLRHQLEFIHQLAQHGVGFYSVVEKPDFTTPQGRMVANMFGVLAQFYSDNLGQEIKKGVDQRTQAGYPWGPPPFGYRTKTLEDALGDALIVDDAGGDDGTDDDRDVDALPPPSEPDVPVGAAIPDAATWGGYRRIVTLALSGQSDTQVANAMNREGRWRLPPARAGKYSDDHGGIDGQSVTARSDRPWSFWSIRGIRTNAFYRPFTPGDARGTIHVRDQQYRGLHRAGCTWEEWQTLQTLFRRDSGRRTGEAARYAEGEFMGLASCAACGERLYVDRRYYRDRATRAVKAVYEGMLCPAVRWSVACPSAGGIVRATDLRAAWVAWLSVAFPATAFPLGWERSVSQQTQTYLRRRQIAEPSAEPTNQQTARDPRRDPRRRTGELSRELKRWQERRQAAIDARLDGWIDATEARTRVAEADAEMARLHGEIAGDTQSAQAARAAAEAEMTALLRVGQQGATWAALWPQMTRDERVRAARLMLEPEGLRVRVPRLNQRGRHAPQSPARARARQVGVPDARVVAGLIVEVRLRPDFAHALALLRERAPTDAPITAESL